MQRAYARRCHLLVRKFTNANSAYATPLVLVDDSLWSSLPCQYILTFSAGLGLLPESSYLSYPTMYSRIHETIDTTTDLKMPAQHTYYRISTRCLLDYV